MGSIVRYLTFFISIYFAGLLGIEFLEVVKNGSIKNITKGFRPTLALSRALNP
jgi:hypothetical protein